MNKKIPLMAVFSIFAAEFEAMAAEVKLEGVLYTHSCGYYSSTVADLNFTYLNTALPWGSKVQLRYGWETMAYNSTSTGLTNVTWYDQGGENLIAISPYVWGINLKKNVHNRSESKSIPFGIDFVLLVTLPNGAVFWEKGSNSPMGYYVGKWNNSLSGPFIRCVNEENPPLDKAEIALQSFQL